MYDFQFAVRFVAFFFRPPGLQFTAHIVETSQTVSAEPLLIVAHRFFLTPRMRDIRLSNLTFSERVTEFNLERLSKLVQTGPSHWPGAKYVILCLTGSETTQVKELERAEQHVQEELQDVMENGFDHHPAGHLLSVSNRTSQALLPVVFHLPYH